MQKTATSTFSMNGLLNRTLIFEIIFIGCSCPSLSVAEKPSLRSAHDDRYFDVADRVIRLRQGVIENPSDATLNHAALADIEAWRAAPPGWSA